MGIVAMCPIVVLIFLAGILHEVVCGYVYCISRGLDTGIEFSKNVDLFSSYYRSQLSILEFLVAFLVEAIPLIILILLIQIGAAKLTEYICAWIEKNGRQPR